MAVRRKRSISIPPELDDLIRSEAASQGVTYSAWLTEAAQKELKIRAGLQAVAEVEEELGGFSAEELADAEAWAEKVLQRRHTTTIDRSRQAA